MKGLVITMDKRQVCVQHYIDKGYSKDHAEAYVPQDKGRVQEIFEKIQKEKKHPQEEERNNPLLLD